MLGKKKEYAGLRKTYLNIKEGAIVKRTDKGEERYTFVEGVVENISQRERTFRNEKVTYWYIDLRDIGTGELYAVGFPYASNVFKSIVLQLASADGLIAIKNNVLTRIEPYNKEGKDKVQVFVGDNFRLNWITKDLPPVTETTIGTRVVKDDTARMAFIVSLVEKIKQNLPSPHVRQTA